MDSRALSGTVGRGKHHPAGATPGRWPDRRQMARTNDPGASAASRVWTALGGGKFLQRSQTDDGLGVEHPPTGANTGCCRGPSIGLRAEALAAHHLYEMFSTERAPCPFHTTRCPKAEWTAVESVL